MIMTVASSVERLRNMLFGNSNTPKYCMMYAQMSSSAMPEAVAEVRKIGTMTAEFHSSRDLFRASTNAVVVCR